MSTVKKAWVIEVEIDHWDGGNKQLLVIVGPKPLAVKAMCEIRAKLLELHAQTAPNLDIDGHFQKMDRKWKRAKLPHGAEKPDRYYATNELILSPLPLKLL